MQRHILDYNEAMPVVNILVGLTPSAIQNAKMVLVNQHQDEQRFPNPSTEVHLLVEELIKMSPSGRAHYG